MTQVPDVELSIATLWPEENSIKDKSGDDPKDKVEDEVKQEEENVEVKVSERYSEEDADVTIVSSDGMIFKVHSFLLVRASQVFKSMIGMAQSTDQRDPINLTDPHVEHSVVVTKSLDIIYDREVGTIDRSTFKLHMHVIEFARKWDIPLIIKTLKIAIRANSHPTDSHSNILFNLAVELGDNDLISLTCIMLKKRHWSWATETPDTTPSEVKALPSKFLKHRSPTCGNGPTSPLGYIRGASSIDLGGWAYATFALLPKPIIWAMLRARKTTEIPLTPEAEAVREERWSRVPAELKKLLDLMYPEVPPKPPGVGPELAVTIGGTGAA